MGSFVKNIKKVLMAAVVIPGLAFAVQAPNPRSIANNVKNTARSSASADPNLSVRRSATSVIARSVAVNGRKNNTIVRARSVISRTPSNVSVRSGANFVSNNAILSRSATSKPNTIVRSTAKQADTQAGKVSLSRVAKARATAVFDDVSKIGGGYSSCRDAYATCMDQFCAIADDAYRRCYCSDKFATLRDTSDNINTALGILVDFQNNNLNAINKTAAEVDAMYSSTAGEMAIKKDTSASQKMLDEIGDVLSGKKNKKGSSSGNSSLGIIDFTGLADVGDVWSSDSSTVFNSRASDSMSGLEGRALYKRASSQCASIMGANCVSDTMFNLASSAYSIMVTQDCNVLEKTVNAKKENLMQTVRKAEQILRNARLEEYRAHNSQDVNECLNKVEAAMTEPLVCGQNYEKCLDYTGLYINATTGEPISHQLFDLNKISPVLGDIDVIESNPRWNEFLDSKQKFVVTALDTCRNLAGDVWLEYKRSAMVRIAQMQDAKIEQFKNSCVQTIKECYNTNDDTLKDLTDDVLGGTAYDVGATRAITVRNVCYQDVLACAAMYGDVDGCQYDQNSRKIVPRKGGGKCGLSALLAYVDSVDTARVAQGCEATLIAKTHDMCDPIPSSTTYTTTTTTTTSGRAAALARSVSRAASSNTTTTVTCLEGEFVPEGAESCSYCSTMFKTRKIPSEQVKGKYCPGGTYTKNVGVDQGIENCPKGTIANSSHTGCVVDSTSSTLDEYPAGCKDWQLSKIQDELEQHAIDFCAINLAAEDRSNVNVSERTTINLNIIKNAIDSVFERLCMDLGYDSKTCHGNYASDLTEEDFNNKHTEQPSSKAKDRLQELVDDYNEHVESNKGAGYGDMGGFGNDRVNVYLDTVLSPEEKAKQLVTKGEDVASQVANIEKDFLMSEAYGTKEMLEGQTQSTLFQSGDSEGAFAGYASYAPGFNGASTTGSAPAAIGIVDSAAVGLNAMEASSVNAGVATGY